MRWLIAGTLLTVMMLVVACGRSASPGTSNQGDIGAPATQLHTWPVTERPLDVADLPRGSSALNEYFDLLNPINVSANYTEGYLELLPGEEMAWAIFQVNGYSADSAPQVLRLYEGWATCDQFWVGFADFARGVWRWVPADKDLNTMYPNSDPNGYDGHNLVHTPDDGQYYRESDGAAFITILIADIEPGDTKEAVGFQSARLAAGTGEFYETKYLASDQEQLEALRGYSAVNGELNIDCSGLPDLGPLSSLVLVTGDFTIVNCDQTHVNGLANLLNVGGTLTISAADLGIDLTLPKLKTAGGLVCPVSGAAGKVYLPELTECANIALANAPSLSTISLPKLTTVAEGFSLDGEAVASGAGNNVTLELPELTSAGIFSLKAAKVPDLTLPKLGQLESLQLSGIDNVREVHLKQLWQISSITFDDVSGLTEFELAVNFSFVSKDADDPCLYLDSVDTLQNLAWFESNTTEQYLGALRILNCPNFESIAGVDWLSEVSSLELANLPALTDGSGLDGVALTGELLLSNTGLAALPYFGGLPTQAPSRIDLRTNPNLVSTAGLAGINGLSFGMKLIDNPVLSDLSGFASLTDCGRELWLENNDSLADLDAFSSLTTFSTHDHTEFPTCLLLKDNTGLTDISGLSGLQVDLDTGDVLDWCIIIGNGLANGDQTAWDLIDAWGGPESAGWHVEVSGNG